MDSHEGQRIIATQVDKRGYRKGFTDQAFVARQAVKLVEEAIERFECTTFGEISDKLAELMLSATHLKALAKEIFDDKEMWTNLECNTNIQHAIKEDADCFVVLSCDADGMEALSNTSIDIVERAVHKAKGDVMRGVR